MDFFKRHFSVALFAVLGLIMVAYVGAQGNLQIVFGVVVPYLAVLIFVEGFVYRLIQWARSPVPFRIPTTAGQGRTLPWIERDLGENWTTRRPSRTCSAAWPWKSSPSAACSGTCAPSCARTRTTPKGPG